MKSRSAIKTGLRSPFQEGSAIESETNISIHNAGGMVTLTVAGIVAADDNARFFCHAENVAGSATSSAELHVMSKYRRDRRRPVFLRRRPVFRRRRPVFLRRRPVFSTKPPSLSTLD